MVLEGEEGEQPGRVTRRADQRFEIRADTATLPRDFGTFLFQMGGLMSWHWTGRWGSVRLWG